MWRNFIKRKVTSLEVDVIQKTKDNIFYHLELYLSNKLPKRGTYVSWVRFKKIQFRIIKFGKIKCEMYD